MTRLVRRRALLFVALLGLVLAGCRVQADVDIAVREDGSGVVTVSLRLDAAAVRVLERGGTKLDDAVVLDDLRAGGWEIDPWVRRGKRATLTMRKEFVRLSDLPRVLGELDGAEGVIRDVAVERSVGRLQSRQEITAVLDLSSIKAGIGRDQELASRLRAIGVDVSALDRAASRSIGDSLTLRVHASMPYGEEQEWTVRPGDNQRITIAETHTDRGPIIWAVVAVIALAGAFALLLAASRSAFRARSRAARRSP